MPATLIKMEKMPVSPKKRYRFLIEWACENTSDQLAVKIRWFDSADAAISTWTLMDKVADAASTWQINAAHVVPPAGARYARLRISKANVATKFAVQRVELREHDSSLEKVMREIRLIDDFCSTTIGQLPWATYSISGNIVATKVTALGSIENWSEFGIVRLTTGVTSGYGGNIHLERLGYGMPPVGAENRWKVRMQDTTNLAAWLGLWSALNTYPDEALANSIQGIGFRVEAAGSSEHWFGVTRDGTTETTQDMGVTANSTWRDLGWYTTDAGVQFTLRGEDVGSVITTHLPDNTANLVPVAGILTATSAAKEMDLDFFGLQLYLDRI